MPSNSLARLVMPVLISTILAFSFKERASLLFHMHDLQEA